MRNMTNFVATSLMIISLFGFMGNVAIDFNWGTTPVVGYLALIYWMTLRWLVPFPINYWGVGAVVYFSLFLLSFAVLNRKNALIPNLLETVRLGSMVTVLFELGVFYFVPGFMNKWVINAVRGTWFAYFTNWDVLFGSIVMFTISQSWLMREGRKNRTVC